ncbi:WAT1-related protein At1g43650-like isoform X3 [Hevea brasiliensis]|uniref:WAT1-related protein At1g43650-like isoform X3 n=1 Tax=Hevea brasiliensis TaxID=3981 RepID=UPI0025EE55F5|nr:WAT1-related protein At1g43650-like isoform X3 [Hevea brasiliensis]
MKSLVEYASVVESRKPYIAVLFIQFVYAGMALLSKAATARGMNPFVFVVYRQAFASVALAPFAIFLESKKAPPLSNGLLCKIFLVSFCGLTLSLNLYYSAINYTTATFAAATTNTIPAITFIMAAALRMETVSIKHVPGIAKLMGSATAVSGALVFALVKGPPLKFMNWNQATPNDHIQDSSIKGCCSSGEWIKGSLLMISANILWSLWFVLQGPIVKQYPAKLRLTALQCFFSCIQSACWAVAVERNPSGHNCEWNFLLATSLDNTEERTSFRFNVLSISTHHYCHFLCILVERNSSFGKCWWGNFVGGWTLWSIMGEEQGRRKKCNK